MALQQQIGESIKRLRANRGWSQEELAARSAIDRRYMSDIELGKRNLSLDVLERLSAAFGISVSTLLRISESGFDSECQTASLAEWLRNNEYEETVILENPNYLNALIGVTEDGRLVYSYDEMVEHLMAYEGMSEDEAVEFIEYNTVRAIPYMGEHAPIIIHPINLDL
ncbi:MAG: helix-turn-helix transcriptional regulator [Muribaculaceae bacterium]|nr:helix-turn-helix transcriptional regulator [Muribaculaceae bacterium]